MNQDMININDITFVSCPQLSQWPITTSITSLNVGLSGVEVQFDKRQGPDRWPDNITPGWGGPLQYSLGMAYRINNKWYGSAPIETWFGKNVIGGPIQSQDTGDGKGQITANWFYDGRWLPLNTYQPKPGELIAMFVAAGDCRNAYNPVQERSNIVLINLPNPGKAENFTFDKEPYIMITGVGNITPITPCNWEIVPQADGNVIIQDIGSKSVIAVSSQGAINAAAPGTVNQNTLATINGSYAIYNPGGSASHQFALLIIKSPFSMK